MPTTLPPDRDVVNHSQALSVGSSLVNGQSSSVSNHAALTTQPASPASRGARGESSVLTYSLGAGAPSGASIDPTTGVFTWAVPRTQPVGSYQITVNVTDVGPKTVNEETELRFTISATDDAGVCLTD